MKGRNFFPIAFPIAMMLLLSILNWSGCSKMGPVEPVQQDEPEEPVELFGRLSVDSDPDSAEIFLNKVRWPDSLTCTPAGPDTILAGEYELTVKKQGYRDFVAKIIVEPGGLTVMNPYLEKLPDSTASDTTSTPVIPTDLNGHIHFNTVTREMMFTGIIFGTAGYDSVCFDGSIYPMRFSAIWDGRTLIVEEYYTFANVFFGGRYNLTGWWYYNDDGSGRDNNCITYNTDGLEWYREGSDSWWKLLEPQLAYLKVTSSPSGASILLDNAMYWPNHPLGYTVTPSGVNVIGFGYHTITVSLAGYIPQSAEFTSIRGDTIHLHFDLVPISPPVQGFSIKYFDGGDSSSSGDTLKVTGTELFKLYKVLVLNGADGPILHIDMETGVCYNTGQTFEVLRDGDKLALPMGQFAHKYNRVTFKKNTDPNSLDDWYYDGRDGLSKPVINNLVVQLAVDKDQWYTILRV